ncbi:MAG: alpha/beta fold hydrolase [Actinobacteria bacterium]|nr:alpha/beta fold hydrolase [Actinomycetota bacterium]
MTEPTSPQVQLVVELTTRPGAQPEMRAAVERLVDTTHQHDRGVVRFEVGLDPDDDTRVLGYEIWASQDALDEHSAQAHTREFLARARELVVDPATPLRVSRWQPIHAEQPAAYGAGRREQARPAAPPPGFTSQRRSVGDTELHYVIGGAGTPVVLVHGFPGTWYAWREVMPRLAERHTVVAVDLRGLGDSEPGTQPADTVTDAGDLHGLVAGLGLGPVRLAGQDWGGSAAFAFAAAHPDQVRRLAVLEAMPAGPWTDPGSGGPWFVGFHQLPDLPERMVAGRERAYLDWFYRAYSATPGVPDPAAVDEYVRCYSRPGAMASAFARYRGVGRQIEHNTRQLSQPLGRPVLAVGGERVFGAAVAQNLRHGASEVRQEVLAGCGHYVSEERPAELAGLLLSFFNES